MGAADRGFTWSDEETNLLLRLWSRTDAQSESSGNKRNFVVYGKISAEMSKMGYIRTTSQCREKIKRMKREYTLTKQKNEKRTKGSRKNMRFFEQFEKILKEKQRKNKNLKNDISKDNQDISNFKFELNRMSRKKTHIRNIGEMQNETHQTTNEKDLEKEIDDCLWAPDVVLVEEDAPSTSFDHQSKASASSENEVPAPHSKRKLSYRKTLFKEMMESLALKLTKYQEGSDEKILGKMEELENERHAIDQNIQKMWIEFEERRRADEREHELKVMSAFQNIIGHIKRNSLSNNNCVSKM